jgi:multisubunit Na+/H+ antiporter MnhB subunit
MRKKASPISTASIIFGFASVLLSSFAYAGLVFGILAILLSLYSRKTEKKFETRVIVALILGIIGTFLSSAFLIFLYTVSEETFNEMFKEFYENFYNSSTAGPQI